jgi:uncharacterized membrane protein
MERIQGEGVMFNYLKNHRFKIILGLAVAVIAGLFMPPLVIGSAIAVVAGQVAVGVVAGLISAGFFAGLQAPIKEKLSKTTDSGIKNGSTAEMASRLNIRNISSDNALIERAQNELDDIIPDNELDDIIPDNELGYASTFNIR